MWQLSQDDRTKHQHAAENFATTEILAENQPASDNRDTGFQAENQGGYSWVHIFLTDDLQGVGNATGHNSGIENRNFCGENSGKIRTFKDQRRDSGEDSTDQKLDTGHFYTIYQWREMVDCKDM